jgi:predicted nucleotidyltransferase
MPGGSSTSAGATYLNRAARIEELRSAARRARERHAAIQRVVLFGSLASGTPTPRSDADLLVVVESSPHDNPRDRIPELLQALSPLPCPLDLFVLTREELNNACREDSPLVRTALANGQDLL